MKIKYLHFRHVQPDVIKDGHYKVGEVLPTGGMCVAYQLDDKYQVLGFAISRCHKHDNYVKQQGRVKATGRLASEKYFVQVALTEQEFIVKMDAFWDAMQDTTFTDKKPPAF